MRLVDLYRTSEVRWITTAGRTDQAEDRNTREQGEYPLRENLPAEDRGKHRPKELSALGAQAAVKVERLEHVGGNNGGGPERDGGVDERLLKDTGEGVPDEL